MKYFFSIVLFSGLLATTQAFSQDTLFFMNYDTVLAKVITIGTREIQYKKYSNLDGPSYFVSKSKVNRIVYPSGEGDFFNPLQPKTTFEGQQGTIVFVTGDSVYVQLIQMDATSVRYKKLNNLDGPDYVARLQKVHSVNYSTGEKIEYNSLRKGAAPKAPTKPISKKIKINWDVYYYGGKRISSRKVIEKLESVNDAELNEHITQIKNLRRTRNILGYSSLGIGLTSITLSYFGLLMRTFDSNNSLLVASGWGGLTTFVALVGHGGLKPVYHDRLRQAIILYNQKVEQ